MQSYLTENEAEGTPKKQVSLQDLENIRAMAKAGKTMQSIAAAVGMSTWCMRNSLRRDHNILIENGVVLTQFTIEGRS